MEPDGKSDDRNRDARRRHRRDDTSSEPEANPVPPAEDATTAEDVQDTPQLPPEGNRGRASE